MAKITNKEFEAEFSRLIEEGYDVTRKQLADQIIAHGHELEEPWSAVPARFKEGLGEYGAEFSPKSKEGEWQMPTIITEGVPSALQLLAGGVQYLGEPPGFTLNPISLAGKGLSRVLPDYTGMVDAALEGAGDFVKDPIRTAKYYPAEVVTTLPSLLAPALGAASKVPAIATKLPKLASGLQKTAKVAPMVSDPLGELSGRAVGGLGSLAVQGVSEFTPVVGRRSKRSKLKGVANQVDPEMIELQQMSEGLGFVDPVNPKTGAGGLPAPVVNLDPGAVESARSIARKGGENAILKETRQLQGVLEKTEEAFLSFYDGVSGQNPAEAFTQARIGLDDLRAKMDSHAKEFEDLGLEKMSTPATETRSLISQLEGGGDLEAKNRGSYNKAVEKVLKNPNVQAFKEQAVKPQKTLSGQPLQGSLSPEIIDRRNLVSATEVSQIPDLYRQALSDGDLLLQDAIESVGVKKMEAFEARQSKAVKRSRDESAKAEKAINSRVTDLKEELARYNQELDRISQYETAVNRQASSAYPYQEGGRRYRLTDLIEQGEPTLKGRVQKTDPNLKRLQESGQVRMVDGRPMKITYLDQEVASVYPDLQNIGSQREAIKQRKLKISQEIEALSQEAGRQSESISASQIRELGYDVNPQQLGVDTEQSLLGIEQVGEGLSELKNNIQRVKALRRQGQLGDPSVATDDLVSADIINLKTFKKMKSNFGSDLESSSGATQSTPNDYNFEVNRIYKKLYSAMLKDELQGYADSLSRLENQGVVSSEMRGRLSGLIDSWREIENLLSTGPVEIVKRHVQKKLVDHPEGLRDVNGDILKVAEYNPADVSTVRQLVDDLFNKGWKLSPSFKSGAFETNAIPDFRQAIGEENFKRLRGVWLHDLFENARGPSGRISDPKSLRRELDKLGSSSKDRVSRLEQIGGGGEEGKEFARLLNKMASTRTKAGERLSGVFNDKQSFNFDDVVVSQPRPSRAWDVTKAVGMTEMEAAVLLGKVGSPARMGRAALAKALVIGLENYQDMLNNPAKYKISADDLADAPTFLEMVEEFKNLGLPVRISRISRQVGQKEARDSWQDESKVSIDPEAQAAFDQMLGGQSQLGIASRTRY